MVGLAVFLSDGRRMRHRADHDSVEVTHEFLGQILGANRTTVRADYERLLGSSAGQDSTIRCANARSNPRRNRFASTRSQHHPFPPALLVGPRWMRPLRGSTG